MLTLTREMGMSAEPQRDRAPRQGASENVGPAGRVAQHGGDQQLRGEEGAFFSETENAAHERGLHRPRYQGPSSSARAIPIGKTIERGGRSVRGRGRGQGQGLGLRQSQDNFVVIPVETYFKIWGSRSGMDYGLAMDHEHLMQAQEEARMLLRAYRHLKPKDDDTFSMLTSDALLDFWNQLTGAIAATAVGVVSVFMVVGGVVIMNIMLAVVTERTHEIGIRKSVGARNKDILNQFLVESSMLAAFGGLDRSDAGLGAGGAGAQPDAGAHVRAHHGGGGGRDAFGGGGPVLRHLPGAEGAQLDPIEALRMEK
jgi:putative ABC transport system permease protein